MQSRVTYRLRQYEENDKRKEKLHGKRGLMSKELIHHINRVNDALCTKGNNRKNTIYKLFLKKWGLLV